MLDLQKLVGGIAKKIVQEYDGFNLDREDLISEGYLIAVEQMANYKPNAGTAVQSYLYGQVTFRLRNYVNRVVLKDMHGTEGMRRVSMELVDQEMSLETDHENKMSLDEFRMGLYGDSAVVFDMIKAGYTYAEISRVLCISTGAITNMKKSWRIHEV